MTRTNKWPLILLFTLAWATGLARAAPPAETTDDGTPSAQDGNAPHNGPPSKTNTEQPLAPRKASRPNVEFKPSEEISEDFSVAFPTDI